MPRNLYSNRLMVFVDGTNLLLQLSKHISIEFRADKPPLSVLNLCRTYIGPLSSSAQYLRIREYWFQSYQGDDDYFLEIRKSLHDLGFEPKLFKKRKGKEKGVDIGLTKEMLVNAFNQNFDIAILIAGDQDYVGLVEEVKRYGQRVYGGFFENGLSNDLKDSFDVFYSLESIINASALNQHKTAIRQELNL